MDGIRESVIKKGFIPLACDRYAGISWQGEVLKDFWMWNGKFNRFRGGVKHIRTVKVTNLKDAAVHYWRDGWVPLQEIDEEVLDRMEQALRAHGGLKRQGCTFPDGHFLEQPKEIPEEWLGPDVRAHLGLAPVETGELIPEGGADESVLSHLRDQKRVERGGM